MFAYCENSPNNGWDPTGKIVFGFFGVSFSGGFGVGGNCSSIVLKDDKGNAGAAVMGYYGGGTPNASAGINIISFSTADDIFEYTYGDSVVAGGSLGFVTIDIQLGTDTKGKPFWGITLSLSASVLPAELHSGFSYGMITELYEYQGKPVLSSKAPSDFREFTRSPNRGRHNQTQVLAA